MSAWVRLLLGGDRRIGERNVWWNIAGSGIYALTSMLLGALVTRVLGADSGGIFFFAFSTFGQQMFIAAYFGMRPLQITDAAGQETFGEYRRFRYFTCAAALLLSFGYAAFMRGTAEAKTVLLWMALYKVLDGFADCFESEFHRQGRLYLAGKSIAFRTLISVLLFTAVLLFSRNLTAACVASVLGLALSVLLFCRLPIRAFPGVRYEVRPGKMADLFRRSGWLFLSAFLDLYIFAASKYAVNRFMTSADNSYYTTIFIPTSVINLMANFVIRPVLTGLSEKRERGEKRAFLLTAARIGALIAALTALGMAAAYLIGIPVLSLLVGSEAGAALLPYRGALVTVILGGGFYALLNLLYYILVILEGQRIIFAVYLAVTAAAWLLSNALVRRCGIDGAALSYLVEMVILTVLFAAAAAVRIRTDGKLNRVREAEAD